MAEFTLPNENSTSITGLGATLLSAGRLTQQQVEDISQRTQSNKSSFVSELMDLGLMSPSDLAVFLSQAFGVPLLDLAALDVGQLPLTLLDGKVCVQNQVIPLAKRNTRLVVATADPTDRNVEDRVKFASQTGNIDWVVAEYDKIIGLQKVLFASTVDSLENIIGQELGFSEEMVSDGDPSAAMSTDDAGADAEDAPIVRFLHKVLLDAYNKGASDLHFEPYEHYYRIRFRIDGELQEYATPPVAIKEKLASRIKVISRLDISEKRVPQDGRMKLMIGPKKVIDFRVSTLPTLFGEKVVIRILDSSSAKMGVDALGYEPVEKQRLMDAIDRPYGMILVTGPTGSGKTVSLYSCLNLLNKPGVNIATAEDPSEINMPGVNQVNVNEKAGLTFAAALRAFLRQDPDIIMVGEIRDLETADIAIKAAQTGHLVLSTLHTNDAPSTLTRLRNMGVAPFNIASSVLLITAQRLARRLCMKCKSPMEIPRQALLEAGFKDEDLDGSWTPYGPVGCPACNNGYKGRVGIYQVMPVSEEIQRIILKDGSALDIEAQSRKEGVMNLRESGLLKVKLGITSLEEVLATTNE